jgi:peptide-methionine (S)-S-oxide reductase
MRLLITLFLGPLLLCCNANNKESEHGNEANSSYNYEHIDPAQVDTATFAGGCFWCVEASFEQITGVVEAVSGFAGGDKENPLYQEVANGNTNHAETVQIYYDPQVISFETLLDIFFTAHDPTQLNRQGPDIGPQYRSVIFYHNEKQKLLAEKKIKELQKTKFEKNIVTQLVPYAEFWQADDYHQDYEKKHPEDPYIQKVSRPKIQKVAEAFRNLLKEE